MKFVTREKGPYNQLIALIQKYIKNHYVNKPCPILGSWAHALSPCFCFIRHNSKRDFYFHSNSQTIDYTWTTNYGCAPFSSSQESWQGCNPGLDSWSVTKMVQMHQQTVTFHESKSPEWSQCMKMKKGAGKHLHTKTASQSFSPFQTLTHFEGKWMVFKVTNTLKTEYYPPAVNEAFILFFQNLFWSDLVLLHFILKVCETF